MFALPWPNDVLADLGETEVQLRVTLSYFVEPKIPWAHIDIAGVHATESDSGCFVKGPTGWGVRLLADLLAG